MNIARIRELKIGCMYNRVPSAEECYTILDDIEDTLRLLKLDGVESLLSKAIELLQDRKDAEASEEILDTKCDTQEKAIEELTMKLETLTAKIVRVREVAA